MGIHSREGEAHRPAVGPEGCRSDDIRRCVKMAMGPWEGALPLPGTITIHSRLNEGPSPAVGVGGAVTYPSAGGAATPASPYCQHSPRAGAAGTIETNPNACRYSPWGHEDPYGCLHPTSAPLRRTAQGHIHSRPRHGRQQGPQESGGPRQGARATRPGSPPPYGPPAAPPAHTMAFLPKRQKKLAKSLHSPRKSSTFALAKRETHRGVEQLVARQAHNLEVACSSPASATPSKGAAIGCALVGSEPTAGNDWQQITITVEAAECPPLTTTLYYGAVEIQWGFIFQNP